MAKAKHPRYKSHNRPRKHGAAMRRRMKTHQKRAIALGIPAEKVAKMNTEQLREALKRPVRTRKAYAKGK